MARRKRSIKQRIAQHFARKQHVYIRVLMIAAVVVVVVWGAQMMTSKEGEHQGVVEAMSGTPEEKYQQALTEVNEGDLEQGRIMMLRLARLGDTAEKPLGYGKAHVWIAEDILTNFSTDSIWDFPLQSGQGKAKVSLSTDGSIFQAQKHLQHAVALNPELPSPPLLLAATYTAQNKRNMAVDVLLSAISHEKNPHPRLHIPLANVLSMKGDDLALKEKAWHLFSSLGQDISSSRGRDVSMRVKYVLSALLLQKYENAEIVIRRLESQYSPAGDGGGMMVDGGSRRAIGEVEQVRALRMAYHYHRAIHRFLDIKPGSTVGYEKVVDELEQVLTIQPDCESAIEALSMIVKKDPSLRQRVQKILQAVSVNKGGMSLRVQSKLSLTLAMMTDGDGSIRRTSLEKAIEEDPHNGEALLRLIELLTEEDKPDYGRIKELAKQALIYCRPEQHAACYRMLGLAHLRTKNWKDAIVTLEKSLAVLDGSADVHSMLAEAYKAVGKNQLSDAHGKMAIDK